MFALLFGAVAEWTFWDEFGVRFNFIAVDYLVYTTEVLGNIRESYPMPLIVGRIVRRLSGTDLAALAPAAAGRPGWTPPPSRPGLRYRQRCGLVRRCSGVWTGAERRLAADVQKQLQPRAGEERALVALRGVSQQRARITSEFYPTHADRRGLRPVARGAGRGRLRDAAAAGHTTRCATSQNAGPELQPNVIQITVESLSADFLSIFNRASNLTPNLAEIAGKSLVFDNFYATGTRTDRGMEALTLALPPTPGRSMIKRPRNEDMFTLGSVFRAKGYDTAFIYGGFGYFDNMNYFFGHNGYRVIDRTGVAKDDITFANVWGACDEDLFRWTMREADTSAATGKPFHYFRHDDVEPPAVHVSRRPDRPAVEDFRPRRSGEIHRLRHRQIPARGGDASPGSRTRCS